MDSLNDWRKIYFHDLVVDPLHHVKTVGSRNPGELKQNWSKKQQLE